MNRGGSLHLCDRNHSFGTGSSRFTFRLPLLHERMTWDRYTRPIMRNISFRIILVVGLLVALSGLQASAQYENGSLVGTIHDATGAVVANANVSVTNIGTGIVTSVTANASGDYAVPSLRVGSYSIKAEAPSFAPVEAQAAIRAVRQRSTRRIWT